MIIAWVGLAFVAGYALRKYESALRWRALWLWHKARGHHR